MKLLSASLALIILTLASRPDVAPRAAASPVERAATATDGFAWLTDLEDARTKAAREKKPLIVVFRCER